MKRKPKTGGDAPGDDGVTPKKISLTSGTSVPLDGDLVYLIDALYREFAIKRGFEPAYGDVQLELTHLLEQMDAESTRDYFAQSLFLNYVTYENEMAERLADQIAARAKKKKSL